MYECGVRIGKCLQVETKAKSFVLVVSWRAEMPTARLRISCASEGDMICAKRAPEYQYTRDGTNRRTKVILALERCAEFRAAKLREIRD